MDGIGKRIKQRREELGLSQDQLAKLLGYKSRSTIAKIEAGINDISQSKIEEFAKKLLTTTSWLMGESIICDRLEQLEHDFKVLDAKIDFSFLLERIIEKMGYIVEERFASDADGDTTLLLEGSEEKFEIKQKAYDDFEKSCFSYIDYSFQKLIDVKNRVKSDYFEYCFESDRTEKQPFEIMREYLDSISDKETSK